MKQKVAWMGQPTPNTRREALQWWLKPSLEMKQELWKLFFDEEYTMDDKVKIEELYFKLIINKRQ